MLDLLSRPDVSVVVNLLAIKVHERPRFFAELLPDLSALRGVLEGKGWEVTGAGHELLVQDATAAQVGAAAHAAGLELHGLRADGATLEEIFLGLVGKAATEHEQEAAA